MDAELLQRFMRRLDHIEYTVGDRMREDLSQLQSTVGRIQKARRMHDDESGSVLPIAGSHRGPGVLPPPAGQTHVVAESAQAPEPAPAQKSLTAFGYHNGCYPGGVF